MRHLWFSSVILGAAMWAGAVYAKGPATQPVGTVSGDVYLLPFTSIGKDDAFDWAGKAVQENLLTDLARNKLRPVAADKPAAPVEARASAKAVRAKYLIAGTYQTADQLLRFNGQIIDVATGDVVGGITATGAERDLFTMEDALSAQAIQQLAKLSGRSVSSNVARAVKPLPPGLQPAVVIQLIQPPAAGQGSSYEGSALQSDLDSNRTPSTDFNSQLQDARNHSAYAPFTDDGLYGSYLDNYGLGVYYIGGPTFGGFGYNTGFGGHGFGGHGIGGYGFGGRGFGASGYFGNGAHGRW